MTFSRLLPLLLLVPALAMADDDRNFKLMPENFKVGGVLEYASKTAIVLDSSVAFSQEPVFPLQPNRLYLRQKKSVKEYLWFSGDAKPEEYKNLHAFNLKDNHLSVREVLGLRLYASRQYKAFQDEADIYFDANYIYSPRVAKLLFMKNGKWQTIKESVHPGMIQVLSDEKNLEVVAFNSSLKGTSKAYYPVKSGNYIFSFSAPDKLPYVDIGTLKDGGLLVFNVEFVNLESSAVIQSNVSVTVEQVQALKTLEETEKLYDVFSSEVDKNVNRVDTTEFSNIYPALKSADSVGLIDSSAEYRNYVYRYNLKRSEAQKLWRNKKLGQVSLVFNAFHAKLDSLQALPIQINMRPVSFEKIMKTTDSTKVDSIKLHFGVDHDRIDVSWKGVVEGVSMDSLVKELESKESSLVTTISLVNNKPVWIFKEGNLVGRYQYRYDKVAFRMGDSLYVGKGDFALPMYLSQEPEIIEWLASKSEMKSIPMPSTNAGSSSSVAVKDSTSAKIKANIVEHDKRGTVAIIDSGSFRYRGKVVSMSPYAIHTTEVTQEFFNKVMETLDSTKRQKDKSTFKGPKKPVQNINWEKAQYFCKVLGGDLPTEAQWEYAGRAGSNEGTLWSSDDVMSVSKYAIFADNSFKEREKDSSAYGPQDVATRTPNDWGLYDMSGNVAEWTLDNYFAITFKIEDSNPTGSYWGTDKVLKGGSWKSNVKSLNMTARDDEDPRYWSDYIGFRCAFPLERIIQEKKK